MGNGSPPGEVATSASSQPILGEAQMAEPVVIDPTSPTGASQEIGDTPKDNVEKASDEKASDPPTTPQPGLPAPSPKSPPPTVLDDKRNEELEDEDVDDVPEEAPQPALPKAAADARLRRVVAPRANGTYLVPKEVVEIWKDKDKRDSLRSMFEKCNHCAVP